MHIIKVSNEYQIHMITYDKTVGERSNFKKIPTHTHDHGDA